MSHQLPVPKNTRARSQATHCVLPDTKKPKRGAEDAEDAFENRLVEDAEDAFENRLVEDAEDAFENRLVEDAEEAFVTLLDCTKKPPPHLFVLGKQKEERIHLWPICYRGIGTHSPTPLS